MASHTDKTNKAKSANAGRDFVTERFIDALILSRAYFDSGGRLDVQRVVADALLIKKLVYPMGLEPSANDRSAADTPEKGLKRRVVTS